MSTQPLDIYEYRAAFLEWYQENVGQTQRIYLAENSSALLQTMEEDVLKYASLLYNRFASNIDAAELDIVQHHFSSNEPSDRAWNHEDIQCLFSDLLLEKQKTLSEYCRYQSILGEWYDMMEWLNTLLPRTNYVTISIEDSVPNFVHRLFEKYFHSGIIYRRDQLPQDIAWLGKWALIHLGGTWWKKPDGLRFLFQLIEEHNELFAFY